MKETPIAQKQAAQNWRVESSDARMSDRSFDGFAGAVFVAKSQTAEGWPSFVRDVSNRWIVWPMTDEAVAYAHSGLGKSKR